MLVFEKLQADNMANP
uniref:Uncharacterized protein n=1 Tax=Rhizophora mucronata TaxID=61149 RepID=A0A2P2PS05_RHIMU